MDASKAGICPRIENLGRVRSNFRTNVRRLEKGLPAFVDSGGLEATVVSSAVTGSVIVGVAFVGSTGSNCEGSVKETERMTSVLALKLGRSFLLTSAEFLLDDDSADGADGTGVAA